MPSKDTPTAPDGATPTDEHGLPDWGARADYANAVLRVGKAREAVAKARCEYEAEVFRLNSQLDHEAEMMKALLAAIEGSSS